MASTAKTRIFDTVDTAYGPITHGTESRRQHGDDVADARPS